MNSEFKRLKNAIHSLGHKLRSAQAKSTLLELGWSYRSAAPILGVMFVHLSKVLNGHRCSRRLLKAIGELPPRTIHKNPAKTIGETPNQNSL